MTAQEKLQAAGLRELVDAGKIDANERECQFVRHMAHKATMDPHFWLSAGQGSWLGALAWKYRDELAEAGKWKGIVAAGKPVR